LVEQIAKDAEVSTRLVSALDEHRRSELEDWLAEIEGDSSLSTEAYLGSLKRVLFAIAVHGNAVIVGRGSNFYLPPDMKIGLCLVAPLDVRIKNTMKALGLSEKEARKQISKQEEEHWRLVKNYFHADMRDSTHYHLVVNTAIVNPETIVQIVKILVQA
jgi:cytidylate kinase